MFYRPEIFDNTAPCYSIDDLFIHLSFLPVAP